MQKSTSPSLCKAHLVVIFHGRSISTLLSSRITEDLLDTPLYPAKYFHVGNHEVLVLNRRLKIRKKKRWWWCLVAPALADFASSTTAWKPATVFSVRTQTCRLARGLGRRIAAAGGSSRWAAASSFSPARSAFASKGRPRSRLLHFRLSGGRHQEAEIGASLWNDALR